jgi:hypothetical protein
VFREIIFEGKFSLFFSVWLGAALLCCFFPKLATVFPQELIAKLISVFRFFRVYQQIN